MTAAMQLGFAAPPAAPPAPLAAGMRLRPYQEQALAAVAAAERAGTRRQMLVLPTGAGKTIVFASLIGQRRVKSLVLAHRDELIEQAVEKIRGVIPGATTGVVKAQRDDHWAPIVVASVQTLRGKRLAPLNAYRFGLVIIDEAHHAASPSYRAIVDALGCGGPDGPLLVGVTATPVRGDRARLDDLFDQIVFEVGLLDLIGQGYLCDIRAVRVQVDGLDLDRVERRHGDYVADQLERALADADQPVNTALAVQEHAAGRKTLVFTASVALARETAAELLALGISAEWVAGELPMVDRRAVLERFRIGRTQVVCNCLDAETEILTRRGWVGMADFRDDDITAAVDPVSFAVRWEPVSRVVRRPRAAGEAMVRIHNQTLDIRVTQGHRMLVQSPGAKTWSFVEAGTLPERQGPYCLSLAGHEALPGVELTDAELEFIGLFVAEGHLNQDRASVEIAQADHAPECAEIERILTDCGFDWRLSKSTSKAGKGAGNTYRRYRIPKGNIGGQLARRGWGHLEPWLDKNVSPLLDGCTARQFGRFLYGLWLGDGNKADAKRRPNPGLVIFGANRTMLDRLQAMGAVRGYGTTLTWHPNGPAHELGDLRFRNRVAVQTNNHTIPTSGGNPASLEREHAAEEVWCVTNQTGTIITRRRGRVVVMGQCMVLTEGFDAPDVDCVVIARPTTSRALYQQMVGRGLRTAPGKADCVLIDVVGVTERHDLQGSASLAGIDFARRTNGDGPDVTMMEAMAMQDRLFSDPVTGRLVAVPVEVFKRSRLAWGRAGPGAWTLPLSPDARLAVVPGPAGWDVLRVHTRDRRIEIVSRGLDARYAHGMAEELARAEGQAWMTNRDAFWRRSTELSEQQVRYAARIGLDVETLRQEHGGELTKGQLSDAIDARVAERQLRAWLSPRTRRPR